MMQVLLPSGDTVWVNLAWADGAGGYEIHPEAQDVGLRSRAQTLAQAAKLDGFTDAIRGVVSSVRRALDECQPDEVTVDFGIQIVLKTGGALSVLAETGGTAQIRVSASWRRHGEDDAVKLQGAEDQP